MKVCEPFLATALFENQRGVFSFNKWAAYISLVMYGGSVSPILCKIGGKQINRQRVAVKCRALLSKRPPVTVPIMLKFFSVSRALVESAKWGSQNIRSLTPKFLRVARRCFC